MKDPYVQSNGTLKNKLNIVDPKELEKKERKITSLKVYEISERKNIKRTYDINHLKNIHKKIFEDIYEWAGKIRNVDIAKGNTLFCKAINIENYAENIFSEIKRKNFFINCSKEDLAYNLAKTFLDLNALHPFREGNGRTQREFIRELTEDRGYIIDFDKISKEKMIEVSIKDNAKELSSIFSEIMTKIEEKKLNPFEELLKERQNSLEARKNISSWEEKVLNDKNSLTLGKK